MTRILHMSDPHFGAERPEVVEALEHAAARLDPSVVVVSGDLTQRARRRQFAAAGAFLRRLARPVFVVPGNHDIPLWNVARRLLVPYARWHRVLDRPLELVEVHDRLVLIGLNTVRSRRIASGRLSRDQVAGAARRIAEHEGGLVCLVTHHHLVCAPGMPDCRALEPRDPIASMLDRGVDLVLSGHHHIPRTGLVSPGRRRLVACSAGTATSHRYRGQPNAFHLVETADDAMEVVTHAFDGARFRAQARSRYVLDRTGWRAG